MKKTGYILGLLLFVFMITNSSLNAQQVYSCQYKSEADINVYVSDYSSDADLIVYKCDYRSEASGNEGEWYFVNYKSEADKYIYM